MPQGDRRHFKRRDVTAAMVSEDKFLQVPLMMAERAWSYAMQLRQESNTEPRKKFHLISRLKKAAVYSLQLQDLIEVHFYKTTAFYNTVSNFVYKFLLMFFVLLNCQDCIVFYCFMFCLEYKLRRPYETGSSSICSLDERFPAV